MTTQYINLPDITVTNGSDQVSINTTLTMGKFTDGDLLFVNGQDLPLVIVSASNSQITLRENATFDATNANAILIASNISLREAMVAIKDNNASWALHFSPFINWISTSDMQAVMYDTLGNAITVYSAQGLNQLAADIADASTDLDAIESRVNQAEQDLNTIEGTLDSKVDLANQAVTDAQAEVVNAANEVTKAANEVVKAQDEVQNAKDWASSDTEVETGLESSKTYASQSLAHADAANQAKLIAAANANYKGEWSELTGALNIPASVKNGSGVYMLNTNLADVTLSEPAGDTNPDWFTIGVVGGDSPNAERLGGELPEYYATKVEVDAAQSAADEAALLALGVR